MVASICSACIAIAICVVILYIAYIIQSYMTHKRDIEAQAKAEEEVDAAEKEFNDALASHNLARISRARGSLHRLRDKEE